MTDQEIKNSLNDLLAMVHDGKIIEAIDKYYHDEVVTQEGVAGEPSVGGKKGYIEHYKKFLADMTRITTFKGTPGLTGQNVSTIAWELDFDNKGPFGVVKFTELALQEWQDNKIIRETFFYR